MPQIFRATILGLALGLAPAMVVAQTTVTEPTGAPVAFGSLKGDPTLPVEVTADQLNVNQADGTAIFTGNVIVDQGTMHMSAAKVEVNYAEDGKKIVRLHATGGVTIANGGEAAEGQEAVYTIESGVVVMTGDVLLTQGSSALSGKKLTVNLTTGTGVMEGRVQTVFVPATSTP